MTVRAATALLLLLAGGCGFSRGAVLARRVEPGPPLEDPGSDAYRLWHDGAGWHLRARADLPRRFHGEIAGAGGQVTPQGVAPEAVSASGGRIRFSFLAGGMYSLCCCAPFWIVVSVIISAIGAATYYRVQ